MTANVVHSITVSSALPKGTGLPVIMRICCVVGRQYIEEDNGLSNKLEAGDRL